MSEGKVITLMSLKQTYKENDRLKKDLGKSLKDNKKLAALLSNMEMEF